MRKASLVCLAVVIANCFSPALEASALQASAALTQADEVPLISLEESLISSHVTTCDEIKNQADQQAAQMKRSVQQQHEQIQSILAVPGLSDRIIKGKKMPADVRALLGEIKKDPKALDRKTAQALKDIAERKQQALGRC
jgi:hypothetical protein